MNELPLSEQRLRKGYINVYANRMLTAIEEDIIEGRLPFAPDSESVIIITSFEACFLGLQK
jgi:hypothetical protein